MAGKISPTLPKYYNKILICQQIKLRVFFDTLSDSSYNIHIMLIPVKRDQFSEKGRQRYYQIKPQLEKKHNPDDVILIEVESGDFFVAETTTQAYKKAHQQYPNKEFFIAQVGQLAALLK